MLVNMMRTCNEYSPLFGRCLENVGGEMMENGPLSSPIAVFGGSDAKSCMLCHRCVEPQNKEKLMILKYPKS